MSQNNLNEVEVVCSNCKKVILKSDRFCPHCGTKNEVEIISEPKSEVKQTKKKSNVLFIVLIVLLIGAGSIYGIYTYMENQRIEKELAEEQARIQEEERIEKARVDKAIEQPLLYWDLTYVSPDNDDTYTTYYGYDEVNDVNLMDQICVIVGVSPMKDTNSEHYLDDSVDGGKFKFNLNEFYINGYTPLSDNPGNCTWNVKDYPIQYNSEFELANGESTLVLFKIKVSDLKHPAYDFTYKYMVITSLNTSTIE